MSIKINIIPHKLQFKFRAGASRGVLTEKKVYYLQLYHTNNPEIVGIGECAPLIKLSIDDRADYEVHLQKLCKEAENLGKSRKNIPTARNSEFS